MFELLSTSSLGIDCANRLWNPWCNAKATLDIYRNRCRGDAVEMTCAAQAAEVLQERTQKGEEVLDVGCGGGYYYWSFLKRAIEVKYYGLDYTPEMIDLACRETCPRTGLKADRFLLGRIENLEREFDSIICFNVLTNNPHYALPLERLLRCARRRVLIRESLGDELTVRYLPDPFLDEGKRHIRAYFNTYPRNEVVDFIRSFGFHVTPIFDRRTQDGDEIVVGVPHKWRILLAERI